MNVLFLTAALMGLPPGYPDVMRVDEDWELILNTPNSAVEAPQFHTFMSPFLHDSSLYAQITWNYRELPSMQPGGLQVQGWNGENMITKKSVGTNKLSTDTETITWTQRLYTTGSFVSLGVVNGQSKTWGTFGGSSTTLGGSYALPNLNQYDPSWSVDNSWITYGSNRVQMLRIKRIRYFDASNTLIYTDNTSRVVHSQL